MQHPYEHAPHFSIGAGFVLTYLLSWIVLQFVAFTAVILSLFYLYYWYNIVL